MLGRDEWGMKNRTRQDRSDRRRPFVNRFYAVCEMASPWTSGRWRTARPFAKMPRSSRHV